MNRRINLSGRRFGKLIATTPTGYNKQGSVMWSCLCDCGNTTIVSTSSLGSGNTKSCGCASTWKKHDENELIGKTFNNLTVVRYDKIVKYRTYWECLCVCGNKRIVERTNLIRGNVKSCGCIPRGRKPKK
jgi:hypothetical protein